MSEAGSALWRKLVPRLTRDPNETRSQRRFRRIRIGIVLVASLVTLQSALMVMGAWRDDRQIERHMGVAAAEVLSAGPRRSTIEFVTPDRVTYRPELGVLYPSELETGMRIYVEYDTNNPDLVRVRDRNASLAIIPAGSIAVVGWLIAVMLLAGPRILGAPARPNSRLGAKSRVDPQVCISLVNQSLSKMSIFVVVLRVVNRWGAGVHHVDVVQVPEVGVFHIRDVDR